MNSQCEACEIFSQCLAACKSSWLFIELCKKQIYIVEELGEWGMPFSQLYILVRQIPVLEQPWFYVRNRMQSTKINLLIKNCGCHFTKRDVIVHSDDVMRDSTITVLLCGRLAVDGGNALLCWRDRRECERGGGETRKQRRRRQLKSEQWADGGRK